MLFYTAMKRLPIYAGILALLVAAGLLGYYLVTQQNFIPRLDAISSNPNSFIRHFSPTWRSLKKLIDMPYIVMTGFQTSILPVYEITISPQDQVNLLLNLPDYPREYKLLEDFKTSVVGEFAHESYYTQNAQIRYRGVSPNHWNAAKKSLQVNLPDDSPLEDRTTYRFFIGEDKGWVWASLWDHIGDKLGVITLQVTPAEVVINGKHMGVYNLIEGWEPSLIARYGKPPGPIFSNKNIEINAVNLWQPDQAFQWYNRNEPTVPIESYPEFMRLVTLVAEAPDDEFAREIPHVLNIDTFLPWTLVSILAGGNFHQGNNANQNFYYNPETGLFEPILWDVALSPLADTIALANNRPVNRLMHIPAFRKQLESMARAYVEDPAQFEDDIALYDTITAYMLPAVYRDTVKIQTSYEVQTVIARERATYEQNVKKLRTMLKNNGSLPFVFADETYPLTPTP